MFSGASSVAAGVVELVSTPCGIPLTATSPIMFNTCSSCSVRSLGGFPPPVVLAFFFLSHSFAFVRFLRSCHFFLTSAAVRLTPPGVRALTLAEIPLHVSSFSLLVTKLFNEGKRMSFFSPTSSTIADTSVSVKRVFF